MNQSLWDAVFSAQLTLLGFPISLVELLGFALAVFMVLCNLRVNPWGWPLGMASSVLYGLLFARSKLYGEAALQVFFVLMSAWGWWMWLRGSASAAAALGVRSLPRSGLVGALAFVALGWPALGWMLRLHTDSDVPFADAFPTVASVLGQYLLGRKYVENWPTWLAVNVVSVLIYAYKGLWLTVLLYLGFIVMSAWGWRTWHRLANGAGAA